MLSRLTSTFAILFAGCGFALAAEQSPHTAVKVGALKGQMSALREKVALMQAVRLLPRDLGVLRDAEDVREIGRIATAVFDEHDVGEDVTDDFIVALERTIPVRNGRAGIR